MDNKLKEEFVLYANKLGSASVLLSAFYDGFKKKYPDIALNLEKSLEADIGLDRVLEQEVRPVAPEVVKLLDYAFEQYRLLGLFCQKNNIKGDLLQQWAEETGVRQKMDRLEEEEKVPSSLLFHIPR